MIISTCQCIGQAKNCCTKFMVERVKEIIDYRIKAHFPRNSHSGVGG